MGKIVRKLTVVFLVAGVGLASCASPDDSAGTDQAASTAKPSATPTPTPTPTPTASPRPPGRDIGLGFRVCDVRKLGGIDFLGDGTKGSAWTATKVTKSGRCPQHERPYLVAADVTGDGKADASWGPLRHCFACEPLGAVDFDADGDDELVVLAAGGSVRAYQVLAAEKSGGSIEFGPLKVAAPGNPAGNLHAGRAIHFWAGGDEGYIAATACDGYPEEPVMIVAWSNHPVDGPGSETTEIHITRLVLQDGAFHVVDAVNDKQPTDSELPEEFSRLGRECGLKFQP
jgi:hypothetical protein